MYATEECPMSDRTATPTAEAAGLASRLAAPIFAILLGTFMLYGVGVAPLDAAHNAAHDSRHSFALPCH